MPGHGQNSKKSHQKKKYHVSESTSPDMSELTVGSLEKNNGGSVNYAASSDESVSASSTPRHPSGSESRDGSVSPRSMSSHSSDRPPASPVKRAVPFAHQPSSPTETSKALLLHDLNEKLVRQVMALRGDKEDLAKRVAQLEVQLNAANDLEERSSSAANERVLALEKEVQSLEKEVQSMGRVQKELDEKQNEFLALRERASKLSGENSAFKDSVEQLSQDKTALLKELEVLKDEKNRLQQGIIEVRGELEEAKNRSAASEEKAEFCKKEGESVAVKLHELEVELEKFKKNSLELSVERDALSKEKDALSKEKDSLISEKRTLEDALTNSRQDFEALMKEVESLKEANKALVDSQVPEEEILALKDSASRLSVEKVAAEEEKTVLLSEKKELEGGLSKLRQELDEVNKLRSADVEKLIALERETEKQSLQSAKCIDFFAIWRR